MTGYTVLDFETTGFSKSDRVIEVAFVNVSVAGGIESEWTSLVNPNRSAGRTDIHGISTEDLRDAPTFKQLIPNILDTIRGRTLVAHNATFDMRFLFQELNRSFCTITQKPPALCTMKWSKELLGTSKLADSCAAVEITLDNAHEALADTRATAELLIHLQGLAGTSTRWESQRMMSRDFVFPVFEGDIHALKGRTGSEHFAGERISETVAEVVDETVNEAEVDVVAQPVIPEKTRIYLSEIHQAMLDKYQHDKTYTPELESLNMEYLRQEANDALQRGQVSDGKFRHLVTIAAGLGLNGEDVERALISASSRLRIAT